jgi:hypothetical protein
MSKKPVFNIGKIVSGINEAAKSKETTPAIPAQNPVQKGNVVIDQALPAPQVLRRTVVRPRGRGGKPTSIWLYARDIEKLQTVDLFVRKNGLSPGRTVLMRAAIHLLQEDDITLRLIEKVLEDDKRTRTEVSTDADGAATVS